MKITRITVHSWRNLRNISIETPSGKSLICVAGENGSGKSNILELLCYAAFRLGLAPASGVQRGSPEQEPHDFEIELEIAESHRDQLIEATGRDQESKLRIRDGWNGRLVLKSRRIEDDFRFGVFAGGFEPESQATDFGNVLVESVRRSTTIHYLWLDSDRSYPPRAVSQAEIGTAMSQQWEDVNHRKQGATHPTEKKYQEWLQYMVGVELSAGAKMLAGARRAVREGRQEEAFVDPFERYSEDIAAILPYLRYSTVDEKQGTLKFDVSGPELAFSNLSGGEREIAFLIGQIHRFKLTEGLFLLDEPELHLNPDLIRKWVRFLRDSISEGQVWLATQSLEVAEAAGDDATVLLEREPDSNLVLAATVLADRPVLPLLARALGNPAFSLRGRRFILVEGEPGGWQKDRFDALVGHDDANRIIEVGGSAQLLATLDNIQRVAAETDDQLAVGGIIDRDYRTNQEAEDLQRGRSLHILGCHEVENLFLHPPSLQALIERSGIHGTTPHGIILDISDAMAGRWVVGHALTRATYQRRPEPRVASSGARSARVAGARITWADIARDREAIVATLLGAFGLQSAEASEEMQRDLAGAVDAYAGLRDREDELWKRCAGKEVFGQVPMKVGAADKRILEKQVLRLWSAEGSVPPTELDDLRRFVRSVTPAP